MDGLKNISLSVTPLWYIIREGVSGILGCTREPIVDTIFFERFPHFLIGNLIFHLSLELLAKFWRHEPISCLAVAGAKTFFRKNLGGRRLFFEKIRGAQTFFRTKFRGAETFFRKNAGGGEDFFYYKTFENPRFQKSHF